MNDPVDLSVVPWVAWSHAQASQGAKERAA